MNTLRILFLAFSVFLLGLSLAACDKAAETILRRAPEWPGYMRAGQCFPFANAAAQWLTAQGSEAKVICFHYRAVYGQAQPTGDIAVLEGGANIYHAVVMYRTSDGWFAFDNVHTMPTWVDTRTGNHSWLERVQVMYPTAYEIHACPPALTKEGAR